MKALLSIAAMGCLAIGATGAAGAVTVDVSDTLASPGDTAYVEVFVQVSDTPPEANGFNISLTLPNGSEVTFGSVVGATVEKTPWTSGIFVSPVLTGSGDYLFNIAFDSDSDVPLTDGVGLARVPIVIPEDAPLGSYTISVVQGNFFALAPVPDGSAFSADTLGTGSITVVPEPASVMLLGGVLGGLVLRRRR